MSLHAAVHRWLGAVVVVSVGSFACGTEREHTSASLPAAADGTPGSSGPTANGAPAPTVPTTGSSTMSPTSVSSGAGAASGGGGSSAVGPGTGSGTTAPNPNDSSGTGGSPGAGVRIMPPNAGGSGGGATGSGGTPGAGGSAGEAGGGGASNPPGNTDTDSWWTITSPGDTVRASIELSDKEGQSGYPEGERLYYTVETGGPSAYTMVLEDSPLGITRADQSFVDGLSFDGATPTAVVEESYAMLTGKKSRIESRAHERVLSFSASEGKQLDLVLRAYDDGFAFRYRFPETSDTEYTVTSEATGFKLPDDSRAWMLPYDVAGTYTPAYESDWQRDVAVGSPSPTSPGWCFPALFQTPSEHWVLLADTDVNGSYFAAHLARESSNNVYRIALPEPDEANGVGDAEPTDTLPWATAWRMVIISESLAPIVESTLATDLAEPSVVGDASWIRPGRASWSWWTNDSYPTNYAENTPYVDLAEDMTWEYSLVDHGWHEMSGGGSWQELVSYADARNVGLLLWYNSGGPHNSVSLTPRDRIDDESIRRSEFESISAAGVKGIKVDFFHADKPWMMQYYRDILRDAAEFHLLVNFHGSTIPRGWQRTYPNLMTAEAARGSEWYKFDANYADDQPWRSTVLVFTRNVVASMDFTPVTFTNHNHAHRTTYGHELALSVVFESGLQHFADRVSGYAELASGPRTFLQQVPVTWDDTRLVEGMPGLYAVVARRKGTSWYLGGISGEEQARALNLDLSFLDAGSYEASIIADGESDTTFSESTVAVTRDDTWDVTLRARGGFVATFRVN